MDYRWIPGARRVHGESNGHAARSPGLIVGALVAYATAFGVWVASGWGGEAARATVADLAFLPMAAAGVALAVRAARRDPDLRRPWLLIAAALGAMLAGDAAWSYLELVAHREPFPSIADPLSLAFYPLMMAGLVMMPVAGRRRGDGLKFGLDSLSVVVGGGLIYWFALVRPLAEGEQAGRLETVLTLAYPVGDLVLIFGICAVLLRRPDRAGRSALTVLALGAALFVGADLAYGTLSMRGAYASGDWPDAIWMAAQCLFAIAAHVQCTESRRHRPSDTADEPARPFSMLPYGAILGAYALLFTVAKPVATTTEGVLLLGAIALTAIVVMRQITVMFENERLMRRLERLVRIDELTGAFTRRALMELGQREWARARRAERPLCALAIDVDHFKAVNDTYGHAAGDKVLATVARRCRLSLRVTDVLGRLGGDEFVAVLPDTTAEDARPLIERLRGLMSLPFETEHGVIDITISIGVAGAAGAPSLSAMLERADEALYLAKNAGRDCVRSAVAV